MFKVISFAMLALTTIAKIPSFPSFDWTHANCALAATYPGQQCSAVYQSMSKVITGYAQGDVGRGVYDFVEQSENQYIWATRTTPVAKYVDDVGFEFTQVGNDCRVQGSSKSRTTSYYDYSTNYCNMYNPIKNTGVYTSLTVSECKFPADEPDVVCNKY